MSKLEKLKELKEKIENNKKVQKWKEVLLGANIALIILFCTVPSTSAYIKKKKSYYDNIDILNSYNQYVKDYADNFDKTNLDDLDVFVKIIADFWKEGYVYKTVDEIPFGYERLFVYNFKFGDCANISDDLTEKINKIDNKYNARNLYVTMQEMNEDKKSVDYFDAFLDYFSANHSVTIVDIEDKVLVIDPTNKAFGILKNGKITMFSDNITMQPAHFYTYLVKGGEGLISLEKSILKSFQNKDNIEKLENLYGEKAQEKSLQKVLSLDK